MDDLYQASGSPLNDLAAGFWRHKGKVALLFLLGTLGAVGLTALKSRAYRSESKLFVRVGRSATLDPSVTTGRQAITVVDPREAEINAVADMVKSRAILDEVIRQFGADRLLGTEGEGFDPAETLAFLNDYNLNPFQVYSKEDDAADHLEKKIKVSTARNSNVVGVTYQTRSPELAQEVLKSLINLVRERHAEINHTRGSGKFFEEERDKSRLKLAALETRRAELKSETGLADLVIQREKTLSRLRYLEDEIGDAEAQLAAAETETVVRGNMLKTLPASVVIEETTGEVNSARDNMREELFRLETKEKEFLSKYKDDSIYVTQVRDQIKQARKVVDGEQEKNKVTRGVYKPNETMTIALNEAKSSRDALKSKLERLQAQSEDAKSRLKLINDKEREFRELDREIELSESEYREFHKGHQQTLIDEGMQEQKITNINELQAPTLSPTPVSPSLPFNLALGWGASCLGALGLVTLAGKPAPPSDPQPEPEPAEPRLPAPTPDPVAEDESETETVPPRERAADESEEEDARPSTVLW